MFWGANSRQVVGKQQVSNRFWALGLQGFRVLGFGK